MPAIPYADAVTSSRKPSAKRNPRVKPTVSEPGPPTPDDAPRRKPLQLIGLGLLIVLLDPRLAPVDVLADWFGWSLVLLGSWVIGRDLPSRNLILGAGAAALATSVATWPFTWADRLTEQEDAVQWAATLPELAWTTLFCLALSGISRASDPGGSFWWKYLAGMSIAAAVLPIFIHGGGIDGLATFYVVVRAFALFMIPAVCFWHAGRDWAVVRRP